MLQHIFRFCGSIDQGSATRGLHGNTRGRSIRFKGKAGNRVLRRCQPLIMPFDIKMSNVLEPQAYGSSVCQTVPQYGSQPSMPP